MYFCINLEICVQKTVEKNNNMSYDLTHLNLDKFIIHNDTIFIKFILNRLMKVTIIFSYMKQEFIAE